jgi:hypothetical protein
MSLFYATVSSHFFASILSSQVWAANRYPYVVWDDVKRAPIIKASEQKALEAQQKAQVGSITLVFTCLAVAIKHSLVIPSFCLTQWVQ